MRWVSRAVAKLRIVAATLLALVSLTSTDAIAETRPAPPQQAAPRPAQIDRNGVLILIRTTLLALH